MSTIAIAFIVTFFIENNISEIFKSKEKQANTTVSMTTRVDPLTSILAVLARSCQILTTIWQPWIPWQDSYIKILLR